MDTTTHAQLPVRTAPFPSWINKYIDPNNATYVEIRSNEQLFEILSNFLVKKIDQSYQMEPKGNVSEAAQLIQKLAKAAKKKFEASKADNNNTEESKASESSDNAKNKDKGKDKENEDVQDAEENDDDDDKVSLHLGYGIHKILYNNEELFIIHQTIGKPQCSGWSCSAPQFHKSLVLMVKGKNRLKYLKNLCNDAIKESESRKDDLYFNIYRWDAESSYWRWSGNKIGRNLDTIILPASIKNKLVNDISRFLNKDSIRWYFEHGIPYKRSYLFYGVPGSGKSSLIQSLAAKYDRNLAFLQPTHPKMTDDSFKSCIQSAPANSLIVLEDIDALFNKDRSKKHANCPLTFSGLLNGLDGVGNPDGQIFILTTNFVDQLDEALIRSGRVDLHIEFPMATDEQLKKIFLLFYPKCEKESDVFVTLIRKHFVKGISMASVQQHFIQNMFVPAKECVEAVNNLGKRLDVVAELNEKTKIAEEDDDDDDKKDEDKEKEMKTEDLITGLKASFDKIEELSKDNKDFEKLLSGLVTEYNKQCKEIAAKKKKEESEKDDKDKKDGKDKKEDNKEKDSKDDKEKEKVKEKEDSKDDKENSDDSDKKDNEKAKDDKTKSDKNDNSKAVTAETTVSV